MSLKMRTRKTSLRKAFTLVELLVVISIIGMLMALLFPAVQAARETARGNTCRSNMRNLALATMQYEKAKGSYPGYANELHPKNVDPNNASASGDPTVRSWIFMALPYLERNDIYEPYSNLPTAPLTWADNSAFLGVQPSQFLEIVQCPSNPPDGLSVAPPTSFVCNTGLPDLAGGATTAFPLDWPQNGVFHDTRPVYGSGNVLLPITRVAEAFVSSGDGTANTIMLTENVDADSWVLTGSASPGTNPPGTTYEFERRLGCNWNPTMSTASSSATVADGIVGPPQEMKINQNIGLDTTFTVADNTTGLTYARPSSYHPGLVNVGFCDGHVRTISQDIDYAVMCRLFTPRGRQSRFPGTQNPTDAVHRIVPLDEKDLQ